MGEDNLYGELKPIRYDLYIGGLLNQQLTSKVSAMRLRNKYASEGWNVALIAIYKTIAGELGLTI